MKRHYSDSELIINTDGSIYHLGLLPSDIPDLIITVGDPERVDSVSTHFDTIKKTVQNREFKTCIGRIGATDIMVISTGIGTDNIDIVINELDALANIDFTTRQDKDILRSLSFVRIGTSGTVQPDIHVDTHLISIYGCGMDSLAQYYTNTHYRIEKLEQTIKDKLDHSMQGKAIYPYATKGDNSLIAKFSDIPSIAQGVTVTLPGFYGPQGRILRLDIPNPGYINDLAKITYEGLQVTNLEMETAGIYYLAAALGHKAISLNAILANRATNQFSTMARDTVKSLISSAIEHLV